MKTLEDVVANLYLLRVEKRKAREDFVKVADDVGACTSIDESSPLPCYLTSNLEHNFWCESCTLKTEAWSKSHAASQAAGGALRSVLAAGKKLAQERGEP